MTVFFAITTALLLGAGIGAVAARLFGRRARLDWARTTVAGTAGAAVGALVGDVTGRDGFSVLTVLGAVLGAGGVLLAVSALESRRSHRAVGGRPTAELVAAGESDGVEFKATARRNLHSRQRDPAIEQVVVKTVAGFLNGRGGTLLVGLDDDGTVRGLDDDLPLMKRPTLDAYELWLRDLLVAGLGRVAAETVGVRFDTVGGVPVCRVDAPPAAAPVFVPAGEEREFWVRVGNSTRKLRTDEVLVYSARRWPR